MPSLNHLNSQQRDAVRYMSGPLLVLAGAGSGKTSVITHKIAHLIEECGYKASQITAVTFTNKAAREMKARVTGMLSGDKSKGLRVSTFHHLGLSIIRSEYKALGLKSGFSIFDSSDSQVLIKELLLLNDIDKDQVEFMQNQISWLKNQSISPTGAVKQAQSKQEMRIARVYLRYVESLRAYNAVDFDDLIYIPVHLFKTQRDVLEKWQNRIRYLLVDEYQDTNQSQYELIKLLVGVSGMFTAVGDDDQSIYAWRGARPENLSELQKDFPSLHLVKLEQNYRSSSRILRVANTLIANNPHLFDKTLWSQHGEGDYIRIVRLADEEEEAERIANEILIQKLNKQKQFSDFAILYRGNHQSRLLEIKLQAQQIPYRMSGGQSFFARQEVKDIMGYLRILINPDDDNAFLRIINTPRRQIGPSTLNILGEYANGRQQSLYESIGDLALKQKFNDTMYSRLEKFYCWLENLRRKVDNSENPISLIREMIDDIDYFGWLLQNSSSPAVAEKRMGNIEFLIQSIKTSMERDEGNNLEDAISKLFLQDLLEQQQEEKEANQVQMLTLHAAKGLEFPIVFMVGMEEELLPHKNSIAEDSIEEERRLAYVGITRAKKSLIMTLAGTRKQYGEKQSTTPSRFLDELPQEDLIWEGVPSKVSAEQEEQRAAETLSSLRNMFD